MAKAGLLAAAVVALSASAAGAQAPLEPKVGADAFSADWTAAAPGQQWLIRPGDLPEPYDTQSASNGPGIAPRRDAIPEVPDGFKVELIAQGLAGPRTLKVAPNGDIFVAESGGGRILVLAPDGSAAEPAVFAEDLNGPYGLAFYPPDDPEWLYVGESNQVVRFPYAAGDRQAGVPPEVVVPDLPDGGHWTRDIAFSPDGATLFIAVGSESNVAEQMPDMSAAEIKAHEAERMVGATWGPEDWRADLLAANADGSGLRVYATGIRNCSGLGIEPTTGSPWCATNERDGLGDNLPPDYITRVQEGGFYGWPWYYTGANEDPRHEDARPDLREFVVVPDVLIQAHSAPLGFAFYEGAMFPEDYRGDIFLALHGSWNRGARTGYKVVRVHREQGQATGVYEDFMTGFVVSADNVWGRPVGIAVAADGALIVSEDGAGTVWRVSVQ